MLEPDDYAWLEDEDSLLALDGFALVLVESAATAGEVVATAGLTVRPGADGVEGDETVQIGRLGGWLTFLAPEGERLILAAGPASRAGRVVGFCEHRDGAMRFVLADGGAVLRSFDPMLDQPGQGYGAALDEEAGLPFGGIDDAVVAAAFTLMERITGQSITRDWLRAPDRAVLVVGP